MPTLGYPLGRGSSIVPPLPFRCQWEGLFCPFVACLACRGIHRDRAESAEKLMVGGGRIELPTPAL